MVFPPTVLSLGVVVFLSVATPLSSSFRIIGSDDQDKPFAAYETGFVGSMLDARHVSNQQLQSCPSDCSSAGLCNNRTGICQCNEFREGDDCSVPVCSKYHRYCTHCSDVCTACLEGYGVVGDADVGDQCVSCSAAIDPRCIDCDATTSTCLRCIDPLLLLTSGRSGPREHDPVLPEDEIHRQPTSTDNKLDEAEDYFVVDPSLIPLNASTVACDQGLKFDESRTCFPKWSSHVVCGSYGTVYFVSPEYEVREDDGFARLYIARTGGGVGTVSVTYQVEHLSTSADDVTPTAFYTMSQVVVFLPGQIEQSFLVTLNDDRLLEDNECFLVSLSAHDGPVQLGKQSRTTVCIVDDDANRTCSLQSERIASLGNEEGINAIAGEPTTFVIQARSCDGQEQTAGSDSFHVIASRHEQDGSLGHSVEEATIVDNENGTYNAEIRFYNSGRYDLDIYLLIPGGLQAQYYNSAFLSEANHDKTRIDAAINFTWDKGPVSSIATDFVSVRWEGVIISNYSETFSFDLDVDDNVRFWIGGDLLIDAWDDSTEGGGVFSSEHDLVKGRAHKLLIEYRDLSGSAKAKLLWSSPSIEKAIVPSASLYHMERIKGSPSSSPIFVRSARTSASKSTANGPGLRDGVAGKDHMFVITPRDKFGNLRGETGENFAPLGLEGFHGVVTLIDNDGGGVGSDEVPVDIRYNVVEHTYDATFSPTISGRYLVNVTLSSTGLLGDNDGDHIHGSPFTVETFPDETFARESIAFVGHGNCFDKEVDNAMEHWSCSGIYHGLAGRQSTFYIQARDLYRNKRRDGEDAWVTVLHDEGAAEYIHGNILYEGDGLYTARVTPLVAGESSLSVTLNGIHIKGSPFVMTVRYASVDGPASVVVAAQ